MMRFLIAGVAFFFVTVDDGFGSSTVDPAVFAAN